MEATMKSCLIEIAVNIVHTTERAVLVRDGNREVWLPLAHTEVGPIRQGGNATVTIPEWLAIEKELV
jgi:hypothetical protein